MAAIFYVLFIALLHPVSPHSFEKDHKFLMGCPPAFNCGKLGEIRFPFTTLTSPDYCGAFVIDGCEKEHQKIELEKGSGKWFEVESISQANTISIIDKEFRNHLISKSCESFRNNLSLPSLPYASFQIKSNQTFYRCNSKLNIGISANVGTRNFSCNEFDIFYSYKNISLPRLPPSCSIVELPVHRSNFHDDIFDLLSDKFSLEINFDWCSWCNKSRVGDCCPWLKKQQRGNNFTKKIQLALCTGLPTIITVLLFIILHCHQKIRNNRNYASSPSSAKAPELTTRLEPEGNVCLEVPIFSDAELQEATNNFSVGMELGNGGFGTVYYGKLRDGREVAVKRLYDHGYKRVKQFLNEIEILTRVRHKNLVNLYGCSARQSHGLLLVYEYVPNGTVADHLHGVRTTSRALTWPIRMRIAIETATALSHLHASDIIHRDVKTRNILLDENFSVKVADFGLSRLFPDELSHISTAPQGSPGYVDPGYYQCYQLTNKSDVYSFGVVLIELISSLPAVDITRNQHEINLATFALNRIQKCAFDELIDPHLAHKMDEQIRRMTTSVAELAFLCLQPDREMRPSMDEVLEQLKRMESWRMHCDLDASQKVELPSSQQDYDENALLKNTQPPSSSNFDIERCDN